MVNNQAHRFDNANPQESMLGIYKSCYEDSPPEDFNPCDFFRADYLYFDAENSTGQRLVFITSGISTVDLVVSIRNYLAKTNDEIVLSYYVTDANYSFVTAGYCEPEKTFQCLFDIDEAKEFCFDKKGISIVPATPQKFLHQQIDYLWDSYGGVPSEELRSDFIDLRHLKFVFSVDVMTIGKLSESLVITPAPHFPNEIA